jgi:hypothetical protein
VVALVSRHLLPALPELATDTVWHITDVLRAVGMFGSLGLCATLTPWRMLRLKCYLAALCGYFLSDAIVCATWYAWAFPSPMAAFVIQGAGFLTAAIYYWRRSYNQPSDAIEDGYLYCVRHIPSNTQDFLISMLGIYGSDCGSSLYANGHLYSFASGRLVRRAVSSLPSISYHVQRGGQTAPDLIEYLDSMIGTKWTWRENCLTILAPIWRRHRG